LPRLLGGGIVGGIPGALKAKFGPQHEVITTIMLNFIVLALLNYFTATHLKVPGSLHTEEIRSGALRDSHRSFRRSWLGGERRAPAGNSRRGAHELVPVPHAAQVSSFARPDCSPRPPSTAASTVGGVWWRALVMSARLAGIGGLNFVLGYKHYYEEAFASGAGFLGVAVAIVGRNHPVGVVLAALVFATISQGGLAVNAVVPKQMVDVLQAVVIIAVAASVPEVRRLLRRSR